MQYERAKAQQESVSKRVSHFREFETTFNDDTAQKQAAPLYGLWHFLLPRGNRLSSG